MNKVKELRIDSTLWATPVRLVNLLDYEPEKISIETENNANNNMRIHNIRYKNGGFYLTINNLRGYFNFNNNLSTLTMLFDDINQQNKYYQVWKDIFKIINGGHGELKLHEKIRLYHNDLPIEQVFKIHSITIVIKSLIEKNIKFYLELSIIVCTNYKTMISIKIKDPPFTYNARLVNILDFNPKKLSIEKVCAINDELERIYYVKYSADPFYLVTDDLKGYLKYFKEKEKNTIELSSLGREKKLKFIIEDHRKRKTYNQIWDKIKELINNIDGVNFRFSDYSRDRDVIKFNTDIPYH